MRYFAERLTAPLWLSLAARRPREIAYLEASLAAKALSRLGAWAGIPTRALQFRMMEVRDEKELVIGLRIYYGDLAEAQADALDEQELRRWLQERGEERLGSFLAKTAATSSVADKNRLWRALYFVQVCIWSLRQEGGGEAELRLESSPWSAAVIRYAARAGLKARDGSRPSTCAGLRAAAAAAIGSRGLGYWLRLLRAHGLPGLLRGPKTRRAAPKGALWATEHWGHLNLERPEQQSDQFFWQESPLRAAPGLVVFRTPSDPLTAARLESLRAHGLDGIALDPASAADPSLPIFKPTRAPRPRGLGALPPGPLGIWAARETRRYDELRAFWGELFEREGVKLFTTWYKNDANHIAVADAVRDAGGVMALYQRSYESMPTLSLACDTDIHFSWSPAVAQTHRAEGSRIRYHVATGFHGDNRFARLREPGRALRARLEKAGAKRVIALFDENSIDDSRWSWGHERQRFNYGFLLEKILAEPWLALVVKPKAPRSLRRRLGPLAELLAKAEATGRCVVFGEGSLQSSDPPAAAALAADLAVHGHLSAGTAAVEAALAGIPAVLLDPDGFTASPLYRLGVGNCVFNDWERLWGAAIEHWERPGGRPGFADWRPLLDEIDPFRDGRASQRMGEYLAWVHEGLAAGLGRERAMSDAAERYAATWGAWTISEVRGPSRLGLREPAVGM
jgi:hypothetical protein